MSTPSIPTEINLDALNVRSSSADSRFFEVCTPSPSASSSPPCTPIGIFEHESQHNRPEFLSPIPRRLPTAPQLKVRALSSTAKLPAYGSSGAAGMDLFASESVEIPPHTRAKIHTGIAIEWVCKNPLQYYMRIAARSGLSVKHNLDVGAGVIDADYRGEILVCLINNGDTPYSVGVGDKVAQMIWTRCDIFDNACIEWAPDALSETLRGGHGFGSTGK